MAHYGQIRAYVDSVIKTMKNSYNFQLAFNISHQYDQGNIAIFFKHVTYLYAIGISSQKWNLVYRYQRLYDWYQLERN